MRAKQAVSFPDSEGKPTDNLKLEILKAEASLTGSPSAPLDIDKAKRRGARISSALAYNTLPKSLDTQLSIFDVMNQDQATRQLVLENNLDKIGAELSVREWRALWAIPRLLHDRGFYRESDEQRKNGQRVQPSELVISLQDYLMAYGLEKSVTGRGKLDYSGQEVQEAIQGLTELTKPVTQVWGAKGGKRHAYTEVVVGGLVSSVSFTIYDQAERAYKEVQTGDVTTLRKAKFIRITPSKIFFTKQFIRLPEQMIDKLRAYLKQTKNKLTPTAFNIATLLALEANNGNDKIIRGYKTMLANTGQNKDLATRNAKRGERRLNKALDDYKAIGAIKAHKIKSDPLKGKQYEIDIDRNKITGDEDETLKEPKKKGKK